MVLVRHGASVEAKFEAYPGFEKWQGLTPLEIAKQCEFKDIVTVLTSYPTDDRNKIQEELFELKGRLDELQEKYASLYSLVEQHEHNFKEVNRFVKGEQKRKFYARKM
eukprot:TRINITY_DN2908_c0_g1_i2.p1 TRINITY_DN2908_c0_g1~~TRINITY_DN2908_c0_g1_i2.p1  ORF type:complete len:108 (-),score=18.11 TRINITY_DN2908_c0_g1_i2:58-381(-)